MFWLAMEDESFSGKMAWFWSKMMKVFWSRRMVGF